METGAEQVHKGSHGWAKAAVAELGERGYRAGGARTAVKHKREGRWSEVGRAVHRLNGSSAILGVLEVAAGCQAIEERVRAERTEDLAPLVTRLEQELERARCALREVARGGAVCQR